MGNPNIKSRTQQVCGEVSLNKNRIKIMCNEENVMPIFKYCHDDMIDSHIFAEENSDIETIDRQGS